MSALLALSDLPSPVWVVAPHPDDEALGCGGLLAALSDQGTPVYAVLVTDGGMSHPASLAYPRPHLSETRLQEWRRGLQELGVVAQHTYALGLPDAGLPTTGPAWEAAVAQLRAVLALRLPATVLLPWRRDPHPDHRATFVLVQAALSTLAPVKLLEYVVWLSQRGFGDDAPRPGEVREYTFDFSGQRARKERAIAAHASQLGQLIHDDPGGFTLPPEMIERALEQPERYYEL